jgi:hypothetical protein
LSPAALLPDPGLELEHFEIAPQRITIRMKIQ